MDKESLQERIIELEEKIKRLTASLPAHSLPPSMLIRLEELEEELDKLKTEEC